MVTPNRADATCLIEERRLSAKRAGSSPPSPVFDLPPISFMATASASCASGEIEPSDIAPVTKRFMISVTGSTLSRSMPSVSRNASCPRREP